MTKSKILADDISVKLGTNTEFDVEQDMSVGCRVLQNEIDEDEEILLLNVLVHCRLAAPFLKPKMMNWLTSFR